MSDIKQLKITLIRSITGKLRKHKACISGLGLRHINDSVILNNTIENLGMINHVLYLLKIEEFA